MREFISKYADRIHGVLSCFDRMLFRGYLPIMSGWQMAQFFQQLQYPVPGIETASSGARGPREAAWRGFGPERRTAVSVSRGEGEERGTGAADRRARSH